MLNSFVVNVMGGLAFLFGVGGMVMLLINFLKLSTALWVFLFCVCVVFAIAGGVSVAVAGVNFPGLGVALTTFGLVFSGCVWFTNRKSTWLPVGILIFLIGILILTLNIK